jgi:prevent-host-death family protein
MKEAWDLRAIDFAPLSEAKAKLSALVRRLMTGGRRIVITNQGRPAAVLMAYQDYMKLSEEIGSQREARVITMAEWQHDRKKREAVVKSITKLFDVKSLSRKGQKAYKAKALREFDR